MRMLDLKYDRNKPIELNETGYYPIGTRAIRWSTRAEAWEFVVGGGAGFNQLNGQFKAANPAGDTPDNHRVLAVLRNLKAFMVSFDFLKMKPDMSMVKSEIGENTFCRGMSEPGKQYAIYLHHSIRPKPLAANTRLQQYKALPGEYQHDLRLYRRPAISGRVDRAGVRQGDSRRIGSSVKTTTRRWQRRPTRWTSH